MNGMRVHTGARRVLQGTFVALIGLVAILWARTQISDEAANDVLIEPSTPAALHYPATDGAVNADYATLLSLLREEPVWVARVDVPSMLLLLGQNFGEFIQSAVATAVQGVAAATPATYPEPEWLSQLWVLYFGENSDRRAFVIDAPIGSDMADWVDAASLQDGLSMTRVGHLVLYQASTADPVFAPWPLDPAPWTHELLALSGPLQSDALWMAQSALPGTRASGFVPWYALGLQPNGALHWTARHDIEPTLRVLGILQNLDFRNVRSHFGFPDSVVEADPFGEGMLAFLHGIDQYLNAVVRKWVSTLSVDASESQVVVQVPGSTCDEPARQWITSLVMLILAQKLGSPDAGVQWAEQPSADELEACLPWGTGRHNAHVPRALILMDRPSFATIWDVRGLLRYSLSEFFGVLPFRLPPAFLTENMGIQLDVATVNASPYWTMGSHGLSDAYRTSWVPNWILPNPEMAQQAPELLRPLTNGGFVLASVPELLSIYVDPAIDASADWELEDESFVYTYVLPPIDPEGRIAALVNMNSELGTLLAEVDEVFVGWSDRQHFVVRIRARSDFNAVRLQSLLIDRAVTALAPLMRSEYIGLIRQELTRLLATTVLKPRLLEFRLQPTRRDINVIAIALQFFAFVGVPLHQEGAAR